MPTAIAALIRERRFEPTADMGRLAEADCIIICVPTPLNDSRDPDLTYVEGTARVDREDAARGPARRAGEHDASDHDPRRTCGRSSRRRA